MAIDFTIPEDAKEVRARVRKWVQEECIPAEKEIDPEFRDLQLRIPSWAQGATVSVNGEPVEAAVVPGLQEDDIMTVACDQGDALWVGTFSAGLFRIDRATGASTVLGGGLPTIGADADRSPIRPHPVVPRRQGHRACGLRSAVPGRLQHH